MHPSHTAEADAFALAMIVVIVVAFGVIGLILFSIFRNAAKRNREVEDLIDEVSKEDAVPERKATASGKDQPWEKSADWWKKD